MALSHYCYRTTLQCQCRETVLKLSIDRVRQPKQYSLEFAAEGEQGRHVPDMTRQRILGSCCSHRKRAVTQCMLHLYSFNGVFQCSLSMVSDLVWNVGWRPFVSVQLCLMFVSPSLCSCTYNFLTTILFPGKAVYTRVELVSNAV